MMGEGPSGSASESHRKAAIRTLGVAPSIWRNKANLGEENQ